MFLQVREGQEMKSSQLAKQIAFLTVKRDQATLWLKTRNPVTRSSNKVTMTVLL